MIEASLERLRAVHAQMKSELHRVIVGQDGVIDELLLAVLTRGHCLLVGVPGLAKTLLVSSLAKTLDLSFNRIQFTPDLMPSDITGTELLQIDPVTNARSFRFAPGPLFANVVLADEINRTPPKTQAALLEAMFERQVSSAGKRHLLPDPFFVLATQNPIEQEGTYPLPEAQLDRFMFMVHVGYPTADDEREILRRTTGGEAAEPSKVVGADELMEAQKAVRAIEVSDRARRSTSSSARRRTRRSKGVSMSRSTTCARSRTRCSATASSRTSRRPPRGSRRTRSSTGSSPR
jgi:MoxR-like ATPase